MDIYRMQEEAKNSDRKTFTIIGVLGTLDAVWDDPYFGFFSIPSKGDGVFMVKQFANVFPPLDFVWRNVETASMEMG